MKNKNIFKNIIWVMISVLTLVSLSCNDDLVDNTFDTDDVLEVTLSNSEMVLEELFFNNKVVFNWSSGSNKSTGAAIKYRLDLDLVDGDFSNPIAIFVDNVQNTFSHEVRFGDLNRALLDYGLDVDKTYDLKARVTAKVSNELVSDQVASANFNVTTFKPVSNKLFIVGDATPNGWDISNATELTASTTQRGVFVYRGDLTSGNFKFAVSQDGCWCQDFYTKDAIDSGKIIYNEGGSGDDLQWSIDQSLENDQEYKITVDLLNKTIKIEVVEITVKTPPFANLWIVGDASESGWNIDSPVAFNQNSDNPFEFYYEGQLNPGNFKIFAGALGDWCGEWYRPFQDNQILENGIVDQNSGCDVDNKWSVSEADQGRYRIIVDTQNNTIVFSKVSLYLIGDGGPNGWNINNPDPMDYVNGEYIFLGELGADNPTGEFKISKFIGEWCGGEWINAATSSQSITNTSFIYTQGCDGPDNKWKMQEGDAGTYEIRVNLVTEVITIIKQ
ncbi:SusF/SusE family outer membrane protein [Aestuariibaculum suncheonense]|uniref:SusF/SusE family outer membrane protein n=1 Tax=Aestuariibaculum suncheonense TaxID=1028745 RepID=A0A8J6Q8J9_9FLAO|nr:SusF/SusE family outer membrane protein [Aestuariibaculum suncheonense]MBD0836089.1 SusF/SusE family outer membrane protein [Aestuariibaculum suncheonense]